MELRHLRYFLAVAEEKTLSRAAQALHVTQPNLSKQIAELERELGCTLFVRGSRSITLTEEGRYLKRRAMRIIDAADEAHRTLSHFEDELTGTLTFVGGECPQMHIVAKTLGKLSFQHPLVRFELVSGDSLEVYDALQNGSADFGAIIGKDFTEDYEGLKLPGQVKWGLLVRKDSAIGNLDAIRPNDLANIPLICSRQTLQPHLLETWLGYSIEKLNVVASFNLINNAALLVEEGVGCAISLEGLVKLGPESPLAFRRLEPEIDASCYLIWRRHENLSPVASRFLDLLKEQMGI